MLTNLLPKITFSCYLLHIYVLYIVFLICLEFSFGMWALFCLWKIYHKFITRPNTTKYNIFRSYCELLQRLWLKQISSLKKKKRQREREKLDKHEITNLSPIHLFLISFYIIVYWSLLSLSLNALVYEWTKAVYLDSGSGFNNVFLFFFSF